LSVSSQQLSDDALAMTVNYKCCVILDAAYAWDSHKSPWRDHDV